MNQLNVIHHAECEGPAGIVTLDENSVDLVLCDLPYGTTNCAWDTPISLDKLWPLYQRVVKPGGAILLFAKQPFTSVLTCSNLAWYRDAWVWVKNKATGHLNAGSRPLNGYEDILVFGEQPLAVYNPQITTGHAPTNMSRNRTTSSIYQTHTNTKTEPGRTTRQPVDVLYFEPEADPRVLHFNVVNNDDPERTNATQKPVPLCRYLLRTYSHKGAVVLDNCMGSGTTAIACLEEGRHFIGFEKRGDQCEQARQRVAGHQLPALFSTSPPPAPAVLAKTGSLFPDAPAGPGGGPGHRQRRRGLPAPTDSPQLCVA